MANVVVPRAFGGTLILSITQLSILPTITVNAIYRDGVVKVVHRDGVTQAGGR